MSFLRFGFATRIDAGISIPLHSTAALSAGLPAGYTLYQKSLTLFEALGFLEFAVGDPVTDDGVF